MKTPSETGWALTLSLEYNEDEIGSLVFAVPLALALPRPNPFDLAQTLRRRHQQASLGQTC